MTAAQKNKYKVPKKTLDDPVIPYSYLSRRLQLRASFKNDRKGARQAIQQCLNDMVLVGTLNRLADQQCKEKYGSSNPVFVIGPAW